MQILLGLVLAMSITMVLMPLLMRWAVPLGFVDMPAPRKVHAAPIPRVGGLAMGGGVVAAMLQWGLAARPLQALLLGIGVLLFFGVWDDRRPLGAAPKFAGQTIAAAVAIFWGGISIGTLTLADRMPLPEWVALPLTFLFMLGGTNAFNLADGLDGLAGGMAMLCFSGTALLAFTVGNIAVGSAALIIIGAVIGFLRFNTHPARVFMGDGGSQVLGFSAAVLAIVLTQDPQVPLCTALPLLLMGMPIIDTLMVMTERVLAGRSPFKADRRHIHHRLLAVGFDHWEAVSVLYLLQGVLFVAAWYLRFASDLRVVFVFAILSALVLIPLWLAENLQWHIRRTQARPAASKGSAAHRRLTALSGSVTCAVLGATLTGYALWVLIDGAQPSYDVRLFALVLAVMLLASIGWRWRREDVSWSEKCVLYSAATLAVYLGKQASPGTAYPSVVECVLFPVVAVAVLVSFRSSVDRLIELTPLDILILLIVVTVPNLPNSVASTGATGIAVIELVLLFYSLEIISLASTQSARWLRAAAACFLLGVALRAFV
jgi:UDP-GlcNAc:undecaprenyl-phosphate GlcNAc-1-phosphate transferase